MNIRIERSLKEKCVSILILDPIMTSTREWKRMLTYKRIVIIKGFRIRTPQRVYIQDLPYIRRCQTMAPLLSSSSAASAATRNSR